MQESGAILEHCQTSVKELLCENVNGIAQKMKFFIKDFFSKGEFFSNFIFCAVQLKAIKYFCKI